MNRGTQRTLLRRRIDDPEPADVNDPSQFTNAQLDELLNLAAARVQRYVSVIEPAAFLNISRQNIEANNERYPKPVGSWSLQDLRMLDADSGTYVSLGEPLDIWQLDRVALSSGGATRFGFFGRFVRLAPAPTVAVANGLEWWFVEGVSLESGTAHDAESFPFHTGLSNLVVLVAQEVSLAEQMSDGADELRKLIAAEVETIPLYYRRTLGPEVGFSIANLDKKNSSDRVSTDNPFSRSWS